MKSYSVGMRVKVLVAYDRGEKTKDSCEMFDVSPAWALHELGLSFKKAIHAAEQDRPDVVEHRAAEFSGGRGSTRVV